MTSPNVEHARALVIGVARYRAPGVRDLPAAVVHDAGDVAKVLTDPALCGMRSDAVRILTDEGATRSAILDGLHWLADGKPGTRLFFFSGHGERISGRGSYLIPYDADVGNLALTGIPVMTVSTSLQTVAAQRVLILLDACFAGGAELKGSHSQADRKPGLAKGALAQLAKGKGRVLITSCRPDEYSKVLHGDRNSLFTKHLLAALTGEAAIRGDGYVHVLDLFQVISQGVREGVRDQHPLLKVHDMEDNFTVALDRGGQAKRANSSEVSIARDDVWWSRFEDVLIHLYPSGPEHDAVWSRSGGDLGRLPQERTGRAAWHSTLRMLRQGGGGSLDQLLAVTANDYPGNDTLRALCLAI